MLYVNQLQKRSVKLGINYLAFINYTSAICFFKER